MHFEPIDFSRIGEKQKEVMGGGRKEFFNEVLVLHPHANFSLTTTALRAVFGHWMISCMGYGDRHFFIRD